MKLVIVESPAKAKTIGRFLGPGYRVEASFGHIRDLPRKANEVPQRIKDKAWAKLAVDVEDGFRPVYIVPGESRKHIAALRKVLTDADEVLLATDEDREGESIGWHLVEVLKPKVPVRRIAFHEITRAAIRAALANPGSLNHRLVQAQEARRVLDRLFGYELSPVLWKKVRSKLSAGRVQSAAVRLIVDREEARRRFKVSEYWRARATLAAEDQEFAAQLVSVGGRTVARGKDFDASTGALAASSRALALDESAAADLCRAAMESVPWRVARVERKSARQRPAPPFTTSTLQQAASSRLRMSPKQTMRVAQRLYEGINLGGGDREGLITYMRTDSVTLSSKALNDAGRLIRRVHGPDYYKGPRRYKTKSKAAQEAHEGIRPTEIARTPEAMARHLDAEQLKLYRLIWNRTVASQMADALVDRTIADLEARIDGVGHVFRANGSVLRFPGFLKAYGDKRKDQLLPPLEEGDAIHRAGDAPAADHPLDAAASPLDAADRPPDAARPPAVLLRVEPERRETKPPSRYTEASLVKKLEEEGIGRPSTYTPTISTIQDRDYVRKRRGHLVPTCTGMAVNQLLCAHFGQYVDLGFTARMEDSLDDIAAGSADRRGFLEAFYRGEDGRPGLRRWIEKVLPEIGYPAIPLGADPKSGKPIRIKIGASSCYLERRDEDGPAERATLPDDLLIDELTAERAAGLLDAASAANPLLGHDPDTEKPVYLKSGPFGPYVQLGEAVGKKKPPRASLPDGMDPSEATLAYALQLLSLPRALGKDPDGKKVEAGLGRYGAFVRRADKPRDEYRNLASVEHALTINLEDALALLAAPKPRRSRAAAKKVLRELGPHPESGAPVNVLDGRYGPYVSDGNLNATIPKGADPTQITMDRAVPLLADAAERKKNAPRRKRPRRPAKRR